MNTRIIGSHFIKTNIQKVLAQNYAKVKKLLFCQDYFF